MQGKHTDGLDSTELVHLLAGLSRDAQDFAERCLTAAEMLLDAEQPADDLEHEWPDTFPADWLS